MLRTVLTTILLAISLLFLSGPAFAQEPATGTPGANSGDAASATADPSEMEAKIEQRVREEVAKLSQQVNQSKSAQEISAGILQPIYQLAEACEGELFYWAAFTLMAIGVVSYGLQLTLGKLALLARLKLNLAEVVSDAAGLVISLIGLVLTTQAAAQNSGFTQNAFYVLSASVVGVVVGFVSFRWAHDLEKKAAGVGTKPGPRNDSAS